MVAGALAARVAGGPIPDVADFGDFTDQYAVGAAVRSALAVLPRQQRAVLVLRYVEDLPEAQVASLLGVSAGTVKTHAHRGLRALRKSLGGSGPVPCQRRGRPGGCGEVNGPILPEEDMSFSDFNPNEESEGQRLLLTAFATAPVGDGLAGRAAFNEDLLRSVRRQDRKGRRGRTTLIGATAAVAAAVAAGVVVLPSSSTPSKTAPQAATAPKATVKAQPKPKASVNPGTPVTVGSVSYSFDTKTSDTPAAIVLDAAATAIGSDAGAGSEPNVVWGSGPYYRMVSVSTCGGETYTNNTWTTRNGNGVGLGTGPKSASDPLCGAGDGAPFPIVTGFADFYGLGNQPLTEAQVDELPTDPNKLWPILEGFDGGSLTSDPANPHSNASTMFQSIWNLITSEPLSPAFREALLEDAAKIPGVTVEGRYTDSLGRTGTVLHIGMWTMAIDTSDGQVLAMTSGAIPGVPICNGSKASFCQSGGGTTVYVSAGAVTSLPKAEAAALAQANSGANTSKVRVAPAPTPSLLRSIS